MFLALVVLLGSGLWVTSRALEPDPIGAPVAPDPVNFADAVVQVYGADVWGWRGKFAIHTWVAVKAKGAKEYTIYQVIGWRLRRGRPVVSVSSGEPATPWFGSPPVLLHDTRGPAAEALVARVEDAVRRYPYANEYKMWPGPNSNSFTAWIGLEVPELQLDLPAKAIGQAWMKKEHPALAVSP